MALAAKIFGFMCMFGAAAEVMLGVVLLAEADADTSRASGFGSGTSGGFSVGAAMFLGALVLAFLLLVTVGATAFVVGEMAQRQEEERSRRRRAGQTGEGVRDASVRY